jgi:hypothetical protein
MKTVRTPRRVREEAKDSLTTASGSGVVGRVSSDSLGLLTHMSLFPWGNSNYQLFN